MNVLVIIHEYPYLSAVILIVMATIFNYLGTFICFVKAFVVAFMWDIAIAKSTALNMVTFNTNLLDICYRLARNLLEICKRLTATSLVTCRLIVTSNLLNFGLHTFKKNRKRLSYELDLLVKVSPFCMISPHVHNIPLSFLQRQRSLLLHQSIPRF